MKKLIKNKYVLLTGSIIIMSILYFVVEKVIDNYNFQSNNDIITEDNVEETGKNTEEVSQIDDAGKSTDENETAEILDNNILESAENTVDEPIEEINKIYVYITGEVNVPGVVILNEGSRIIDAINAAGGTTTNANITKVNLVYVLEDGMKVNIPNNNDLKEKEDFEYITKNSGDGSNNSSDADAIQNDSSGGYEHAVVNINTATQTELETLPGIGPSLALKIINYRKENGKFSSVDDIKNVSGIGESKYEELKNYIKV